MEDYKVLGRREEEAARLRAETEKMVKAAREGAEQLEKDKELLNVMAANAALGKEKAAAEAVVVKAREAEARLAKALEEAKEAGARAAKSLEEAKEREGHASKALEEANADRGHLKQIVGSLQAEVQTREAKLAEITACVAIVKAILDAPETVTGIDLIKQRARDASFKAGYNRCIGYINILSKGGYTDERSGFRDVDTEAFLEAACASFYDTSIAAVEELDKCLDAPDYVDRLRWLYANADDSEEEEFAGDAKGGASTSGTK
ncbi:translation initiation factor IF-2-like [Helianthus annuus]|uniref:translation initiation factor IF-2-like n=1 Tax=Helianthus annuus TaxID=4232 RepID=UPI000B9005A9|nr:translation initiation factor IF-2-like [Helianthus annuus]